MKSFDDFNKTALIRTLSKQNRRVSFLFALLCAERARICHWAFCTREKLAAGYQLYNDCLKYGFENTDENRPIKEQSKRIQLRCKKIDSIIIDTEDYGDSLSVQAQCAVIALRYAFEIINSKDDYSDKAAWAAYKNFEIIYTFSECVGEAFGLNMKENELYERELIIQDKSIKELTEIVADGEEDDRIKHLRGMNLKWALPIVAL